MKKLLLFYVSALFPAVLHAQQQADTEIRVGRLKNGVRQAGKDSFLVTNPKNGHTETFTYLERMAAPGYDLNGFLADNIKYPDSARIKGLQGKVVIEVIISETGAITAPRIVLSAEPLLDTEAMRVIKLLPPWKPAYRNGTPARVYYSIPVVFKL